MPRLSNLSFGSRVVGLLLLTGLAPLLLAGWIVMEQVDTLLREIARRDLDDSLLSKKVQVEQHLRMTGRQLLDLTRDAELQPETVAARFRKHAVVHGFDELILLEGRGGEVMLADRRESLFAQALRNDSRAGERIVARVRGDSTWVVIGLPPCAPTASMPSICLAAPLDLADGSPAVVLGRLPLRAVEEILRDKSGLGETEEVVLLDGDGREMPRFAAIAPLPEAGLMRSRVALQLPGVSWSLAGILSLDEAMAPTLAMHRSLGWILAVTLLGVALLAAASGKILLHALRDLSSAMHRIAEGEWEARVPVRVDDEPGRMGDAFNRMADQVADQLWLKEHLARFSALMQSIQGIEAFPEAFLRELMELLEASMGEFHLLNDRTGRYESVAPYRLEAGREEGAGCELGEGIVGRCALERRPLFLEGAPGEGWSLATGVGAARPAFLLALPLPYRERVGGVVVLAHMRPLTPVQRQLLEALVPVGGLALDNLARIRHIEDLLEETRGQAAELETSQQELEEMNQELEERSEELTEQNARLAKAREDLERTGQYKSEFLATMSHELRTPLNSILILAGEFCRNGEGNLRPDQVEAAEVMRQSGSELLGLINDLLDLSRIEAGQVEDTRAEIRLETFAEELRRQFLPLARERGLQWRVSLGEGLAAPRLADGEKLRRIVKNLVANAFQFTRQGGVEVRLGLEGERLAVAVQDSGPGIAPEHREAIFTPFHQLPGDGMESRRGGVGLGLAIASRLARLAGGEIRLESEPGQGSTFILHLPCPLVTRRLLLADADPGAWRFLSGVLRERQVTVVAAASGEEALARHGEEPFDCLVVAPRLPDLEGGELLERMAALRPLPPVVIHAAQALTREEHARLRRFTDAIVVDGADREARLHDEILLSWQRTHAPPPPVASPREEEPQAARNGGGRVLLVDDDMRNLYAMARSLEKSRWRVVMANNGAEALRVLETGEPVDIVLMDLMMPVMDGYEAMRRLRAQERFAALPVLALTAKAMPEDQRKSLAAGANGHVSKPVDMERLLETMRLHVHS
ncbi:MAG: response regulator [Magnetococcales bacterium]|nr:response regulator [Magnetococcales bacterium]